MKKLLHIIATPRAEASRTLKVSGAFLEGFKRKYPNCQIDTLDLFKEALPALTIKSIEGKYTLLAGGDLFGAEKDAWKDIERYIETFRSGDAYLISTPMWNFSIPHTLKHYLDIIVQPKYLFQYTEQGPEGLLKNKKMIVITSRGGDYGADSPFRSYDFQEPYLKTIFAFVGIADITFINAQPMDALGPEIQKEKLKEARDIARKAGEGF